MRFLGKLQVTKLVWNGKLNTNFPEKFTKKNFFCFKLKNNLEPITFETITYTNATFGH